MGAYSRIIGLDVADTVDVGASLPPPVRSDGSLYHRVGLSARRCRGLHRVSEPTERSLYLFALCRRDRATPGCCKRGGLQTVPTLRCRSHVRCFAREPLRPCVRSRNGRFSPRSGAWQGRRLVSGPRSAQSRDSERTAQCLHCLCRRLPRGGSRLPHRFRDSVWLTPVPLSPCVAR
jgi:hypothetical protein